MTYDPATDVPRSLWTFLHEVGDDPERWRAVLGVTERVAFLSLFQDYHDARADLVEMLTERDAIPNDGVLAGASEDSLDDIADVVLARGRREFLSVYRGASPPPAAGDRHDTQSHLFEEIYYRRFGRSPCDDLGD